MSHLDQTKQQGRLSSRKVVFCSMSGENEVGGVALPPVSLYLQIEEKNKNYKGLQCLGVAKLGLTLQSIFFKTPSAKGHWNT